MWSTGSSGSAYELPQAATQEPFEQGEALEGGEHTQQPPQKEAQHLGFFSDGGPSDRTGPPCESFLKLEIVESNLRPVHGLAGPVYWLLRRWTGYRLYHLLAFIAVLVLIVGGMAIPFWWLGEQAGNVAGVAGVVIVSAAYLYAATLVLAFSVIVVARLLFGRARKLVRQGGPARTHRLASNERRRS